MTISPTLIAIGGAILAGLLALWRIVVNSKKAGVNEQLAKDARARAENLDKLKRAADAAAGARRVPDDPNNRDNR